MHQTSSSLKKRIFPGFFSI